MILNRTVFRACPAGPLSVGLVAAMLLVPTLAQAQTAEDGRALYLEGDCDGALEILLPLARAGDANAQNVVGAAYDDGCGVEEDHAQTLAWWQKAADQGFARAQYNLGWFWEQGFDGYPADYARARDWYLKAADQDYPEAMTNLGFLHASGRLGEPPDYAAARDYYVRGRALGSAQSINNLAELARLGRGGPVDHETALRLYSEAAAKGLPESLNNLGAMYQNGLGTEVDALTAFYLYRLAQDADYARASINLGWLAATETEAHFYDPPYGHALCQYGLARAPEGKAEAFAAECAEIDAGLTPEQIAEGLELFESWE